MAGLTGWWRYAGFAAVCLGTFLAGAAGVVRDNGRIGQGILVENVPVGGLTRADAAHLIARELTGKLPPTLRLEYAGQAWTLDGASFGRRAKAAEAADEAYQLTRPDGAARRVARRLKVLHRGAVVPLHVAVDRDKLEALIGAVAEQVDRAPQNVKVRDFIGGRLYFQEEQDGLKVDIAKTAERAAGSGAFPPPAFVELAVERVPAKVKLADVRQEFNTVLAEYRTSMSKGYDGEMRENRVHNVRLCLRRLNGTILGPGEVFSFDETVGERKPEDGFRSSYVFYRKPDGTIEEKWESGGGICQLATTIFNTVLRADLKIIERSNHSKPVHYSRPARDATVYYRVRDLKFQNTLARPLLIWGQVGGDYDLVITVIGDARDKVQVDLDSDYWEGSTGSGGTLWRTVKSPAGDVLVNHERICDSFYPYEPPKPPPTPPPAKGAKPAASTRPAPEPEPAKPAAAPAEPPAAPEPGPGVDRENPEPAATEGGG
ncbi:MAG: VanW family protein [Armatimonadetes bacterium]|nr:VanW family protein [Armatimonadota bacterium]